MVCSIAVAIVAHVVKHHAAHVWLQRVLAITLVIVVHYGVLDISLVWPLVVCQCSFVSVTKEECSELIKASKAEFAAI